LDLERVIGELKRRSGIRVDTNRVRSVVGGSINQAFCLLADPEPLFVKINAAHALPVFEAEVEGLEALRSAEGVSVPETVDVGCVGETSYLALRWVEFSSKTKSAEHLLGVALAQQHRDIAEQFGWHRENTIGATPQRNTLMCNWSDFFRLERLGVQLELAVERGLPQQQLDQTYYVMERLEWFFVGREPVASLLHGDLWSGNWGCDASGEPFIYDPAVYYGDREADLAMTRLFGGFGDAFYSAYQNEWPLTDGWEARVDLYNLYHLLNHFNLFGASYLDQTSDTLSRLWNFAR
jgi:fructosamine-3-kinase